MIDRGHIGKRKKETVQKVPRRLWTHSSFNRGGHTLEVPAAGDRYGHWRHAGHGRGEARSAAPQNQIGHSADSRSYQGATGKPRGDQCGPARYMLEVESDPELEKALDRYACRLHPRRLHDAAGYSSRRDGSRNPGRDDGRYPVG